ncbi:endonuclease/exonuclease/phosphatase family protein [Cellulomonas sp. DKR-3]|uniref:Endonuclease/exonuclease/phosphatase family protein n=1 Tax=Cellulomonas fulva TaxID=2835530 RepID=A0ABS5TWA4_9CELL|nr:endonuclease/exonuclease/phosphatase family protein [Cellulomonas fulva]MBT0993372.1 endonuclease/exonuclease/phosphatase family protein [Cellulomonas fulva]
MRIATFNLQHGRATTSGRVDHAALTRAVRSLDADVLALQEVDRGQLRSGRSDQAALVAQASGAAHVRMAPALVGPAGLWRRATARDRGGAAYGVAIVSRFTVREWTTIPLPRLPGVTLVGAGRVRRPYRDQPRVALVAVVETPHGAVTVVGTHLSYLPGQGERQLEHLLAALGTAEPLVVLGDLNLRPPAVRRVAGARGLEAIAAAPTYPAEEPRAQIDHVLGRGVRPAGPARAVATGVSDHRALVVDLTP